MTTAVHAPAHLEVRGLGHKFALQTILEAIDLDVTSGEVVALVGPSGCGKTTLLHLLCRPHAGTYRPDYQQF